MTATQDITSQYERDGFVCGIDIFSAAEIEGYRLQFDELERREGREKCQIGLKMWHLKKRFIWDMATDRRLLDAVEEAMGPNIMLISTHFFCKYPVHEVEHFVAWHQDVTYWGLDPQEAHTAWIAVDDSDMENGCMQFIPGSHIDGIAPHEESEEGGNLLSINQEIPDEHVDKTNAVPVELKAGQISLHDGRLFHASYPNTSDHRRCGLVCRFVAPHVSQVELNSLGERWPAILMRGVDEYGHYERPEVPFELQTN